MFDILDAEIKSDMKRREYRDRLDAMVAAIYGGSINSTFDRLVADAQAMLDAIDAHVAEKFGGVEP